MFTVIAEIPEIRSAHSSAFTKQRNPRAKAHNKPFPDIKILKQNIFHPVKGLL